MVPDCADQLRGKKRIKKQGPNMHANVSKCYRRAHKGPPTGTCIPDHSVIFRVRTVRYGKLPFDTIP